MKKFFTIISLLCFTLPLNAMCPIDDNATVCTLPGFRAPFTPTYNPQSNINEFADTPEARLKPIQRDDVIQEQTREFAPIESNFNYNSSCQFGVCLKNREKPLFQLQSK